MSEPNIGDRRPILPCKRCGAEQFERYTVTYEYPDQSRQYGWVSSAHYMKDHLECFNHLLSRIQRLENEAAWKE